MSSSSSYYTRGSKRTRSSELPTSPVDSTLLSALTSSSSGGTSTMDTEVPGTASQWSSGGRVIELDRPFRPANKLYGQAAWKVPKWQYNKLKKHILSKKKKSYTRRSTARGYSRGSGGTKAFGPIILDGRGGYFTDKLRSGASAAYRALQRGIPSGTFSRLGAAAGGAMFGAPGAAVGGYLGNSVAGIAGFGDYTIRSNSLLTLDEGMQVPSFGDMNHAIVISHREYITDISIPATPAAFTNLPFSINPGLSKTFPWLSTIASSFDQYEIMGMIFEFKSTSSDFGTTTSLAMGTVILATDYDSADVNYQSKIEMENAQYSTSCKPSVSCIHAVECDPSLNFSPIKYVRSGGVPSGKDIRLYDQGTFQIATVGLPTGSSGVIGELWVSYQIKFYKPALSLGSDVPTDQFTGTPTAGQQWNLTTPAANNSIGGVLSGQTYTFPSNIAVGTYWLLSYFVQGSSTVLAVEASFQAFTNVTVIYQYSQPAASTSTKNGVFAILKVTGSPASIQSNNCSLPTGITKSIFTITQLDREVLDEAL